MKTPKLITSSDTAANLIREGVVVALPTETVYGLAADATNTSAVEKIYTLKNRPSFNPLIIHVSSIEMAEVYVELTADFIKLANHFSPGPLTYVLNAKSGNPISPLCSAGLSTLAIRIPSHITMLEVLEKNQKPLAAPSANPSTSLSPTSAEHVQNAFSNTDLVILDGGSCSEGIESTIIDLTSPDPVVLRHGIITEAEISAVLNKTTVKDLYPKQINSPGQLLKHYAPSKPIRINANAPEHDEVSIGFGSQTCDYNLSPKGDLKEAAKNLFEILHQIDQDKSIRKIAVFRIPNEGIGVAINDKLKRASKS